MKTPLLLAILIASCLTLPSSHAATVVFDDFTTGAYDIGITKPTSQNTSSIAAPLVDTRISTGFGAGFWSSTVNTGTGTLSYVLALRAGGNPLEDHRFRINYSNSLGNINLLGFDSFVLNASSVVGSAMVYAFVGTGDPPLGVVPVSLNDMGSVVVPFSNMAATEPTSPASISFTIVPQTLNFSFTLNGITVIPEPSAFTLSAFGACILLARRRPECSGHHKPSLENR